VNRDFNGARGGFIVPINGHQPRWLSRGISGSADAASTVADVGLTASFSRTLAAAGISCNVIAGLAHDHLFVAWDDRAQALLLEL
jgi:hypothetical protein